MALPIPRVPRKYLLGWHTLLIPAPHSGGRNRQLPELESSLVYRDNSRTEKYCLWERKEGRIYFFLKTKQTLPISKRTKT